MKQIYRPYWDWEDYQNGMWRKETKEYEEKELPLIIEFTGDHNKYGEAMIEVINNWKFSCEHNLSNKSINRRAWVGHAACCIKFGWPEYLVRSAWKELSNTQRFLANKQADKAIKIWLTKFSNTLKRGKDGVIQMEFQMKFQ